MILVVTPLPVEAEILRGAGLNSGHARVEVGGHGKVQFALRTTSFISEKRPDLVICAGACGSLVKDLRAGDVVVAESTIEHDFKLRFVERPLPSFVGDAGALKALKNYDAQNFNLHFGKIASGDEDVVGASRASELHSATSALAVAWEGAGGARACMHAGVPFLEIRGVTDSADHAAVENFKKNLNGAMANVAAVISHLTWISLEYGNRIRCCDDDKTWSGYAEIGKRFRMNKEGTWTYAPSAKIAADRDGGAVTFHPANFTYSF